MNRTAALLALATVMTAGTAAAQSAPAAERLYGADCIEVEALPNEAPAMRGMAAETAERFCTVSGASAAYVWNDSADFHVVRTWRWTGRSWTEAESYETTGARADLWFEGKARWYAVERTSHRADGRNVGAPSMTMVEVQAPPMTEVGNQAAMNAMRHMVQRLQEENKALRAELEAMDGKEEGKLAAR